MNDYGITRENMLFVLPPAIKKDDSTAALADTTAQTLAGRKSETDIPRIFPDIDRLDEAVLDILACDLKVDWYDYDYPLKTKREIIKGSVLAHKRLGTVYAVKSVLNSLYPDSSLEEWFSYGGTPGCFRLNVNVTDSAAEGAVIVYSPEEIANRIKTAKRLSAHLENVSYMVRNAIVVGHRIDSWQYRAPECNTLRCGMWPGTATLGHSTTAGAVRAGGGAAAFKTAPEIAGTLPSTSKLGYTLACGTVRAGGVATAFTGSPKEAGEPEIAGTWPETATLGRSMTAGAVRAGGGAAAFKAAPELAGTLPDTAATGYTVAGELSAVGGVEGFKTEPEITGTLPQEAQHGERED